MDAAVRLFRKNHGGTTKVASELKWIGDELADARELDVLIADFIGPLMSKCPTDPSLAKIRGTCIRLREKAYERANAALSSQRFRTFLIDVAEWIEIGVGERKAKSRAKDGPSAKDMASKSLSKMLRKIRAERSIKELDLRSLHNLRLRAKRMRYTIEFTRSFYEENPKRIEGMLKQLGKMQSALGKLTDMASARTILSRIAGKAKAARITGGREGRKSEHLKKAARSFVKIENLKPFWT